ncbi:GNAT family N-acetyltransferase [Mariniluteicoccus flavus]
MELKVHSAPWRELDPEVAYAILRLRQDVFVVEQECAYADLDGRDLEPDCRHVWVEEDGVVLATLRVLAEPDGVRRIGRVATAVSARGRGVAAAMISHAHDLIGAADSVLAAQSQLEHWYARFGYVPDGPRFLEDGFEHTPMRRTGVS